MMLSLRVTPLPCLVALSLTLLAAASCSDSPGVVGFMADCTAYDAVGENPACPDLCAVANEEFCPGVATELDCGKVRNGAVVDVCGVALPPPEDDMELERSPTVDEFAASGPPVLGCFQADGFPDAPGTPQDVTMRGIVRVFSNGCESDGVEIEVYTVIRGGADDGMPDQLIGTAVLTGDDCTIDGEPEENEDCSSQKHNGNRWECSFEYPDVPTETELIVVTQGNNWAPLYEYNVYLDNDEVVDGAVVKDIRAIAQDDYTVIPQVAGTSIASGHGAVGGEVHDCEDKRLVNAVVDIDVPQRDLIYFSSNEIQPLPELGADSTGLLGLYAALDVPAGPVTVASAGIMNGELVGTGVFKARVFAGAVTSVTFRGLRPFQLP